MNPQEFDDLLLQTFEDQHLSRKEKQLLNEVLQDAHADEHKRTLYRHQAFDIARKALQGEESTKVLNWLEEVVKVLQRGGSQPSSTAAVADACFTPGDDCPRRIAQIIRSARKQIDICVFTITDNRISSAIKDAQRNGVPVRIITDDEKLHDPGSDIIAFHEAGIPVRIDSTPAHMHHKFALFDQNKLLTGSYNWTRGAAEHNHENFIVTADPDLVARFSKVFDDLWEEMKPLA